MLKSKVVGVRYISGKPQREGFIGYCPSTHGAAGPYTNPCQFCGAEVTREEIIEEVEVPADTPNWVLRHMGFLHVEGD